MKYSTLATIALLGSTQAVTTEAERQNTMWYVDGTKGFHNGFVKAFYKSSNNVDNSECLNNETIESITEYMNAMSDPMAAMNNLLDVTADFNMFTDGMEIFENMQKCRFEGPTYDMLHVCRKTPEACAMKKIGENLTKNMFVLVGKMTSLAEQLQNFPATENNDFKDQMTELGDDCGTVWRVMLNYHE